MGVTDGMATELYLVRHGETLWNRERRIQGHRDVPLSPLGKWQAEVLARRLSAVSFAAIYSSDLARARETAEAVARAAGKAVIAVPELRERCLGEWEGKTMAEIGLMEGIPLEDPRLAAIGAETFEALRHRAMTVLEAIARRHDGETVLVVSHGGFLNAALHGMTGGRLGTGVTRHRNTAITRVRWERGVWTVLSVADDAHLDEAQGEGRAARSL